MILVPSKVRRLVVPVPGPGVTQGDGQHVTEAGKDSFISPGRGGETPQRRKYLS